MQFNALKSFENQIAKFNSSNGHLMPPSALNYVRIKFLNLILPIDI